MHRALLPTLTVIQTGFCVHNIDATLVCRLQKLSPYIDKIRDNLAVLLAIEQE